MVEQGIVTISAVGNDNAEWGNVDVESSLVVGRLTICNIHKFR